MEEPFTISGGKTGEYQLAFDDVNQAIALNPELADAYYTRGGVYYMEGEYHYAISDYQKALSLKETDYFYCSLGMAYNKIGDEATAIAYLVKGAELDSDNSESCRDLLDELQ